MPVVTTRLRKFFVITGLVAIEDLKNRKLRKELKRGRKNTEQEQGKLNKTL